MSDTSTQSLYPKNSQLEPHPKPAIRAYLGGSFDPVHLGHLQMAMHVYNCLLPIAAEQQRELHVSLLPNARSPFKQQSTDPTDRLAMLKLAVQNTPIQIDELELWQAPPVYTIDSVYTLRQRFSNDSLVFIMGMDSARSLKGWKNGLQLTDYVNLWLFDRSEYPNQVTPLIKLASEIPSELQAQVVNSIAELVSPILEPLKKDNHGRIYIDTQSVMTVSSTEIRTQFGKQEYQQLSTAKYVTAEPNHLTKWLNPIVYQYIIAHQLYSAR